MYDTTELFKKRMKKKKDEDVPNNPFYKFGFTLIIKTLIVGVLFLSSLIYVRQSDKNSEQFKKVVYQNSISFAKIYNTYQKYLGDVVPFKNIFKDNTKVVSGERITYESIKKENDGFMLEVASDYAVPVIKGGIVVEVKNNETYHNLIKTQDKNGLNVTYGMLDDVNVKLYDYVEKGELLGRVEKKLYLIFEKDDKYLSYEEYL